MKKLPLLKPGDCVELIAPASRCSDTELLELKALIESWELHCLVKEDIFAKDLLCANTDEARFHHLKDALQNPKTKAVICARGGYGSLRLIPKLMDINPPEEAKIFVGMSDTTCLQLFLQQQWMWPTIHGAAAPARFSKESVAALKSLLFAEVEQVIFKNLKPLNQSAKEKRIIESRVTGGNLAIIQAGIGTNWQIDGRNKIILLEEIGERGYRVDRMLEHLQQAHIFKGAAAILLGDFLEGEEPNGTSLIEPVLQRFATCCEMPVLRLEGVGHGRTNFPIPCETTAHLHLGKDPQLLCFR
jgi:muramoyltetrapeptide carboxypeptidase